MAAIKMIITISFLISIMMIFLVCIYSLYDKAACMAIRPAGQYPCAALAAARTLQRRSLRRIWRFQDDIIIAALSDDWVT